MIDFLLGVPGKLKTIADHLTTNWTAGRAAKLDLLTVAPAPASTALTNATWTDTRAGKLDSVIQTSVIQSIQTGRAAGGVTGSTVEDIAYINVTISSVNTAKCVVLTEGVGWNQTGYPSNSPATMTCSARLTSATNLRISLQGDISAEQTARGGTLQNISGRWTVIEFK